MLSVDDFCNRMFYRVLYNDEKSVALQGSTFALQTRKEKYIIKHVIKMKQKSKQHERMGALRTILRKACAREVWKLVSLLEYKYQTYLYDAVVTYVKTGRREEFGSMVMQNIFDRVVILIDSAKKRDGEPTD